MLAILMLPLVLSPDGLDETVARTAPGFFGAVLVADAGKILLERGYGGAKADTLFDIASCAKQFTAAAVLKLEQAGKLKTGDPVGRFFPVANAKNKAITLHHLLTHTSGLPQAKPGLTEAAARDRDRFVQTVMAADPIAAPGSKFAYDNHGYAVLAAVIAKVSGKSFEAYLRKELFKPAGLKSTGFPGDKYDKQRLAQRRGGGTAADWPWDWSTRGIGGVVSCVRDLYRWDRALRGGKILNERQRRKLFEPALEGYACGWMIGSRDEWVFHTGQSMGFQSYFERWLRRDRVIVILGDDRTDPRVLVGPIRSRLP